MFDLGTVDWIHPRGFGSLELSDGTSLYFNLRDSAFIVAGRLEPDFGPHAIVYNGKVWSPRKPIPGEMIVFRIGRNDEGEIASPWGFWDQWNATQQYIAYGSRDGVRVVIERRRPDRLMRRVERLLGKSNRPNQRMP